MRTLSMRRIRFGTGIGEYDMTICSSRSARGWLRGAMLALLAAGAVACSDSGEAAQASPGGRGPGGGGPPGGRMTAVETAAVERGTIARDVTVSGTVEPIRTVGINSQLSGALVSVNVQEGDVVRAGQTLARLDDRELRAQVASARANFDVAKTTYERAEQLREGQVITAAEYERDRAAHAAAQAQLSQLETRLGYATIRAPAAGVVTEKNVEAGDIVAPQTRLFTVGDLSTMVVRVPVSEMDVVELSTGEPVRVALDAFPGQTVEGRIRRIFPSANPETRLVPVEVALQGDGARMARPGFLARVTFALGARTDTHLVPASAVVGDAGTPAVFVVENGAASRRRVETGLTSQGRVEILSGVEPGEIVIVQGNNSLRDGAQVRVVSGPGASEAPQHAAPQGDASTRRGGAAGGTR